MKTIILLLAVCFASFAVMGCTNDEGDNELEVLTPNETEENSTTAESTIEED